MEAHCLFTVVPITAHQPAHIYRIGNSPPPPYNTFISWPKLYTHFLHADYIYIPSNPLWYDIPTNIFSREQIIKRLNM
jgi:hypothetical protein